MPRLCSRAMSGRFSPAWTAKLLDLGDLSTSIAQSPFVFPSLKGRSGAELRRALTYTRVVDERLLGEYIKPLLPKT